MKEIISEVVAHLVAEAEKSECELTTKELGEDGFLITNKKNNKVAAVGIVNIKDKGKKEKIVGAFSIDVHKYHWAESEGFAQKQMIEKLNNDI